MKKIIDSIIIALENMQPEKPINKRYADYADLKNILIGDCPSCKMSVVYYDRYCRNCGQCLDWDTTRHSKDLYTEYWE